MFLFYKKNLNRLIKQYIVYIVMHYSDKRREKHLKIIKDSLNHFTIRLGIKLERRKIKVIGRHLMKPLTINSIKL